jgi:hypothetical protein
VRRRGTDLQEEKEEGEKEEEEEEVEDGLFKANGKVYSMQYDWGGRWARPRDARRRRRATSC